jgi:hypothetical protein
VSKSAFFEPKPQVGKSFKQQLTRLRVARARTSLVDSVIEKPASFATARGFPHCLRAWGAAPGRRAADGRSREGTRSLEGNSV